MEDIDMDDVGGGDDRYGPEHGLVEVFPHAEDILQAGEPDEPGELVDDGPGTAGIDTNGGSSNVVLNKIHVQGVDSLHTNDIRTWVKAHYGAPDKVEWIDDNSANLVFASEYAARDALVSLSQTEILDASALSADDVLAAKPIEGRPEISLRVRFSVESDKKEAGAALRSRYYLLHPEHDPEERRRHHRYRDRNQNGRDGNDRRRRDSGERVEPFEASMYDDVPRASKSPRRHSDEERSRSRSRTRRGENRGKELFAGHRRGRDRSASPRRDREGGGDLSDEQASSSNNRHRARSIKDRISITKGRGLSTELFPTKGTGRGGQLDQLENAIGSAQLRDEDLPKYAENTSAFNIRGVAKQRSETAGFSIKGTAASAKELFPDKLGDENGNQGKELLGRRPARRRAEDLFR